MVEILSCQLLKNLLGEFPQPSLPDRKVETNLKIDEIGLALSGADDISPLIKIGIKNSAPMNLFENYEQLLKKVTRQGGLMVGKVLM